MTCWISRHTTLGVHVGNASRPDPEASSSATLVGAGLLSVAADDVFVAVDRAARLVFVSCEDTDAERWLGQELWTALGDEGVAAKLRHCFEQREPACLVELLAGTERYREARAYLSPDGGMHVFIRDVTAEHRAEAARRQTELEANKRAELEQQLLGIVSHDLRNPLQVIRFAAAQGRSGLPEDTREHRLFERVVSASDRAVRMIDDLLDFTRIRFLGSLAIDPSEVDLHALTSQVVGDILSARPERHVSLRVEGDGIGFWDPDRLSQVVQNLVSNALQHTTEGTPVRVATRGEGDHVTLEVYNGGTPIPEQDQPHIFEPFQRGKGARTSGRSLGLGLHITSHIVHAHGGAVSLVSTAQQGTTFTVHLPRRSRTQELEERDDDTGRSQ